MAASSLAGQEAALNPKITFMLLNGPVNGLVGFTS